VIDAQAATALETPAVDVDLTGHLTCTAAECALAGSAGVASTTAACAAATCAATAGEAANVAATGATDRSRTAPVHGAAVAGHASAPPRSRFSASAIPGPAASTGARESAASASFVAASVRRSAARAARRVTTRTALT
jgi:hypothetical protein